MTKLIVVDQESDTRIPFLRGMLVKSLQETGLEFAEAYAVASELREELDDNEEVTTSELRERITEILTENHPGIIPKQYRKEGIFRENITVIGGVGSQDLFSRGVLSRRLESCSIARAQCASITRKVHSQLIKNKIRENFLA